jgi:metal-responsive CopG/Arc/MetJ family transcriptional regulator
MSTMKEIIVSVSDELYEAIEYERDSRKLRTVSEMVRVILTEYFRNKID